MAHLLDLFRTRVPAKDELRRAAQLHAAANFAADKAFRALEDAHHFLLARLAADGGDEDAGMLQLAVYVHARDGHQREARIFHLTQQQLGDFGLNAFSDALLAERGWHMADGGWPMADGGWRTAVLSAIRDSLSAINALNHKELEDVAHLDVVEVLDADPALEALLNFAHVVLLVPERGDLAFKFLLAVAQDAHLGVAAQFALAHKAPGDVANLGDSEHGADFRLADGHRLVLRLEQALEGLLHVLHHAINHFVLADGDAVGLPQPLGRRVPPHR